MKRFIGLAAAGVLFAGAAMAEPHDVHGVWLTEAGTAKVEISDCGDGTPCGDVVWIDPDSLEEGVTPATAVDRNNSDPSLRSQSVIGMTMLADFDRKRNDWRGGTIYDPESGKTYGSRIKRLESGELQVKGCIGPICQTQVWKPTDLIVETAG